MYTEFIVIFILLGVIAALLVVAVVLLIVLLRRNGRNGAPPMPSFGSRNQFSAGANSFQTGASGNPGSGSARGTGSGAVFCGKCGMRYDSIHRICPNCGTPRKA